MWRGRPLRIPVPDRTIDRFVLVDGGVGVATHAAQADDAGLALQHARFADRGDEEEVVRAGGHAKVTGRPTDADSSRTGVGPVS
jgi:hypothetical protein